MKYRLTVKGQVAVATMVLLVGFAAVSFGQFTQRALNEGTQPSVRSASQEPAQGASPDTAPSQTPAASADSEVQAASVTEKPFEMMATVYFSPDQWEMQADEVGKIRTLMDALKANPEALIRVEGNINGKPGAQDSDFGLDLSLKRAQVVAQVLIGNGIEESRITIQSNGSSLPVATETNDVWKNRRTEIYVQGFNGDTP